jgi:hypothetical protein
LRLNKAKKELVFGKSEEVAVRRHRSHSRGPSAANARAIGITGGL